MSRAQDNNPVPAAHRGEHQGHPQPIASECHGCRDGPETARRREHHDFTNGLRRIENRACGLVSAPTQHRRHAFVRSSGRPAVQSLHPGKRPSIPCEATEDLKIVMTLKTRERTRVAIFTDNDFDKVNSVTTTLKAVLQCADDVVPRIYRRPTSVSRRSDYFASRSSGDRPPWFREMRNTRHTCARSRENCVPQARKTITSPAPGPSGWLATGSPTARSALSAGVTTRISATTWQGSAALTRTGRLLNSYMR